MNPMMQRIVFSLIRYALAASGTTGLLSDDQLNQAIGAVATVALIVWSIWKNYRQQQVLVTALHVAAMSEHDAAALVKDPHINTPSVATDKDSVPI